MVIKLGDTKILLDSTQGELEILEFIVNDVHFGINVAKVQEIVVKQKVTPIPASAFGVRGVFNIRDGLYSVIDLGLILFNRETELTNKTYYMLCNFNAQRNSFIVDSVVGIKRVAWSSLMKPDNILSGSETSNIIGILNLDNDIISVLDFEKIVTDINPSSGLKVDKVVITDNLQSLRGSHTILVADDSKLINKLLSDTISKAGYKVVSVEDGEQSMNLILNGSNIELLVTDIEMPVRDGLESSRLIREKKQDFPIIVFSSLANDALRRKVEKLNLNDMITKPELGQLVSKIDSILGITI